MELVYVVKGSKQATILIQVPGKMVVIHGRLPCYDAVSADRILFCSVVEPEYLRAPHLLTDRVVGHYVERYPDEEYAEILDLVSFENPPFVEAQGATADLLTRDEQSVFMQSLYASLASLEKGFTFINGMKVGRN